MHKNSIFLMGLQFCISLLDVVFATWYVLFISSHHRVIFSIYGQVNQNSRTFLSTDLVNTKSRIIHGAWRYEIYLLVFNSFAALTREIDIEAEHEKIYFISPSSRVLFYLLCILDQLSQKVNIPIDIRTHVFSYDIS